MAAGPSSVAVPTAEAFAPRTGRGAQAVALNAHGLQAAPPSPPAPLQPAFQIPPMDWLLGGPAAPLLGEEDDFVAALAPPPYPAYFHGAIFNPPTPSTELEEYEFPPGYGPDAYMDIPTPTPAQSDEDPEHFMPPGFGPVPGLDSPPPVVDAGAPLAAAPFVFDRNVEVEPEDEETGAPIAAAPSIFDLQVKVELENEESFVATLASPPAQATQQSGPPTPPPEARRLLRRFAAAMASRQPGFCAGTWDPASLGFSGEDERGGSSSRRW